jgi:hypothetical protein
MSTSPYAVSEVIQIPNISSAEMKKIARYIAMADLTGFEGHEGVITGDCVQIRFRHHASAKTLELQAVALPADLRGLPAPMAHAALKQLVHRVLALGDDHPSRYGVYNYVIPTINNTSGGVLTFSSSNLSHGTIRDVAQSIANGASGTEMFEADSAKLSGVGTGGTVVYTLADGVTTLNIDWFLNTIYTSSFNPGLAGGNAARYSVSASNTDPVVSGYTYMNPVITLTTR